MADFVAVIRRAVDGLTDNTPEMRAKVYEKAKSAVVRQLENMRPRPPEVMFTRQLDKLDDAMRQVEEEHSEYVTFTLDVDSAAPELLEDEAFDLDIAAPLEPTTEPGLSFKLADDGTLRIAHDGLPTPDDRAAIGPLRAGLVKAVDDLIALIGGSNAYSHIGSIAQRYRAALGTGLEDMSITLMYVEGIRLENARTILEQVRGGDISGSALPLAEALDSVIAVNGPTIMSSELGRELVKRGNAYNVRPDMETFYKERAIEFAERLMSDGRIVERDDARQLVELNSDINNPTNPNRSTEIAHTANANLLATVARLVLLTSSTTVGIVMSQAILDSATGSAATAEVAGFIDRAVPFLLANRGLLFDLASATGNSLRWVDSFIRWLEIQRVQYEINIQEIE